MSNLNRTGGIDPSRLRSFVQPPVDLQRIIEVVANHVAEQGPALEFRLRSGPEGRGSFSFLWLDDVYAPFYHCKLAEAREKSQSTAAAVRLPVVQEENSLGLLQHEPATSPNQIKSSEAVLLEQKDFADLFGFTYGGVPEQVHPPATMDRHEAAAAAARNQNPPLSRRCPPPVQNIIPYGVLQEVHLLDSSGTERSGLNTFIITNDPENGAEDPLMNYLYQSPYVTAMTEEPIYRLRPDDKAIFRASHCRLLPVGFALGAEVKDVNKQEPGIVVRRTVEKGQRLYDVRDMSGVVHEDVAEGDLELHTGGLFDFRLPNQF